MEYWWVYLLTFVFGYITCKTFYFLNTARVSLSLLRASNIIYLSSLVKSLEHLSYAREMVREHMLRTERDSFQISSFEHTFDEDLKLLKNRSIETLLQCHPAFFRPMVEFEDWPSAMQFLQNNKESALNFWSKYENDRQT